MSILLSNDDGIHAFGLEILEKSLQPIADLAVVAPSKNRSGIGHAVTFDRPVRAQTLKKKPEETLRIAVDGTPADAVKFALKHALYPLPELTLTGINAGPNIGVNVLYSGTLGAAFESVIHGIPAVAFSAERSKTIDLDQYGEWIRTIVRAALAWFAADPRRHRTCWNVNLPALPLTAVKGVRWTRHGRSGFDESFHHVAGQPDTYQIYGDMVIRETDPAYDATALAQGWISITPLRIDMTDSAALDSAPDIHL